MSLLATISRAGGASQVITCGRVLASLGLSVSKKFTPPGNHLAPVVQHATSALKHNMHCSSEIDSSNLSLGQAIQDRIERKKYLMGLIAEDQDASQQQANESGRTNFEAPRLGFYSSSSRWDSGDLSHSSPVQQRSTQLVRERSSSMRASASSNAAPQANARLLRFLDPAFSMTEQREEDDVSSSSNLTLMEALRHQRVKIIAQDFAGCQTACNACGNAKTMP